LRLEFHAAMRGPYRQDLAHDFVLPALLFAVLGAMTWAVRGCAGAGGMNAHVAPGLTWGAAWWFLARDCGCNQSRRYSSGWILLALAAGFAIAGERGWMQWPHFFSGQLATNYSKGEYVPIARTYGFIWFFIAGTAWAGLPACLLAWCASGQRLRAWEWSLRLVCGFGTAYLAWRVFTAHPRVFLPLYESIQAKYLDFHANPNLAKLYRDNGASLRHIGFCLGCLLFEVVRRDWKNVKLIASVGLLTGLGWAACQNWRWASSVWPGASFNFGRCWEVSGGICIGIGLGLAYYLANGRMSAQEAAAEEARLAQSSRVSEWWTASGLLLLVGAAMFWPAVRDLRLPATPLGDGPDYLWACIYLAIGLAAGAIGVAQHLLSRRAAEGRRLRPSTVWTDLEWWGELGLILVFGWFIKTQMLSEYGDGVADGALAGWLGPGSLYFAISLLYCVARGLRQLSTRAKLPWAGSVPGVKPAWWFERNLDALAIYLGLTVILVWCLGVGMGNWWHASTFFGIAAAVFGIAYYRLCSREEGPADSTAAAMRPAVEDPNLERWGAFLGLVYGLGLTLRKGLKGATNIYFTKEDYWDAVFWNWVSLAMLLCLVAGIVVLFLRRIPRSSRNDVFPGAYSIIWLVLIAQNVLAQVVTGPPFGPRASWIEFSFSLLYVVLFITSAVIIFHYQFLKTQSEPK
jgi:hypothetical protein